MMRPYIICSALSGMAWHGVLLLLCQFQHPNRKSPLPYIILKEPAPCTSPLILLANVLLVMYTFSWNSLENMLLFGQISLNCAKCAESSFNQ